MQSFLQSGQKDRDRDQGYQFKNRHLILFGGIIILIELMVLYASRNS